MHKNIAFLLNKTISNVDASSINCWKITFTDGSSIELWAESNGPLNIGQLWLSNEEKM